MAKHRKRREDIAEKSMVTMFKHVEALSKEKVFELFWEQQRKKKDAVNEWQKKAT